MSHRTKTNCYNCGKPVYGNSESNWAGHVFCCRNCRDSYANDRAKRWYPLVIAGIVALILIQIHPTIGILAGIYVWLLLRITP